MEGFEDVPRRSEGGEGDQDNFSSSFAPFAPSRDTRSAFTARPRPTITGRPRADAGRLVSAAAPVDLQEIAERSGRRAASRAEARGVRVAVQPGPPSVIAADADAISRALDNLVDNAIRHSPRGGVIEVSVETDGGERVVRVRDDGPGFGAGELPHLFQRFRRGQDAAGTGTGLGLAIVRSVVEAHRGRVSAADRPGGGAEITLTFPVG